MCGRFVLEQSWDDLIDNFDLDPADTNTPEMPPRYNIAPTQPIVTISNGLSGNREAMLARWGLVPNWVKNPDEFTLLINARAETTAEKPSFKAAMRHRRVLIPASGFYEWQRFGKGRKSQPYWVPPTKGGVVAFGGLLETWSGADGTEIDTACIISTAANESFEEIHHRLPLVIQPEDFDRWLDCKTQEPRHVFDLMQPASDDYFEPVPISDAVNKVANADKSLLQRVEIEIPGNDAPEHASNQMSLF